MKIVNQSVGWAARERMRNDPARSIMIVVRLETDDGRPRVAHVEFDPGRDFGNIYPLDHGAYQFRSLCVRSSDLTPGEIEKFELPDADAALVVKRARNYIVSLECFTEVQTRWAIS